MNKKFAKCLSVLLALVLVIGITAPAASAVDAARKSQLTEAKEVITNASLRDIMTKGYRYAQEKGYIAKLNAAIDKALAAAETIEGYEEVRDEVKAKLPAFIAALKTAKTDLKNAETVGDLINVVVDLENALREDLTVEDLKAAAEELRLVLKTVKNVVYGYVSEAMHGEYTVTKDSKYVAITGDNDGYAAILAEALKLGEDQVTVMDWDNIDYAAVLEADLITISYYGVGDLTNATLEQVRGYISEYVDGELRQTIRDYVSNVIDEGGNGVFSESGKENALKELDSYLDDVLAGKEQIDLGDNDLLNLIYALVVDEGLTDKVAEELDWSELLGNRVTGYASLLKQEVKDVLAKHNIPTTYTMELDVLAYAENLVTDINWETIRNNLGDNTTCTIEIPVAGMIYAAAEAYVYNYIELNLNYTKVVLAISELNPDATVVLLGTDNALESVNLGSKFVEIDINIDFSVIYEIAEKVMKKLTVQATVGSSAQISAPVYEYIDENTELDFEIDQEMVEGFLAEPAVSEFVSDKTMSYLQDAITGQSNTTLTAEEIMAFLEENQELFEEHFNVELTDEVKENIETEVTKAVEEKNLNETIQNSVNNAVSAPVSGTDLPIKKIISTLKTAATKIVDKIPTEKITISNMGTVLTDVCNLQPLAYAVVLENVVYVDISEMESLYESYVAEGSLSNDLVSFLVIALGNPEWLDASETGNAYIAQQILNALTITWENGNDTPVDPTPDDPTPDDPTPDDPTPDDPTDPSDPSDPTDPTNPGEEPTDDGLSTGAIVAIIIACVIVLAGIGVAVYFYLKKKKKI